VRHPPGLFKGSAAFLEGLLGVIGVVHCQEIERNEARRVSCDSSVTRLAAGWMRCCSTSNSNRSPITTMISPIQNALLGEIGLDASTISGNSESLDAHCVSRSRPRLHPETRWIGTRPTLVRNDRGPLGICGLPTSRASERLGGITGELHDGHSAPTAL
jgi:hypothetical protein